MARARNIKPAFFKNEELAELISEFRLLFIGIWCLADREGRLENRPKRIKAELFPYDDVNVQEGIIQLVARGFILVYEYENQSFIQIINWSKHQNPHHKEIPSVISPPVGHKNLVCDDYIPLSNTIRDKVYDRDDEKCNYCGSLDDLEIDHILPISKGGNSNLENLQILCKSCNLLKSNKLVNHQESIKHKRVVHESCMNHASVNQVASSSTDSLLLIPSTLIPVESEKPKVKKDTNATRLPNDWTLPDAYRDYCLVKRPELNPDDVAEVFRNYWVSKSGADARKLDWKATWCNWVLRQEVPKSSNVKPMKGHGVVSDSQFKEWLEPKQELLNG
jgi:hypothetical protein